MLCFAVSPWSSSTFIQIWLDLEDLPIELFDSIHTLMKLFRDGAIAVPSNFEQGSLLGFFFAG